MIINQAELYSVEYKIIDRTMSSLAMNMQFLNDFQQVEQLTRILNKMDMRHAKNMAMRHRTQSTKLNVHSFI